MNHRTLTVAAGSYYRSEMDLSVSLPDDDPVTARLEQQPNVSAYIYRAVRRLMVTEELAAFPAPSADEIAFAEDAQASTLDAWAAGE